jgi:hypothetical protein
MAEEAGMAEEVDMAEAGDMAVVEGILEEEVILSVGDMAAAVAEDHMGLDLDHQVKSAFQALLNCTLLKPIQLVMAIHPAHIQVLIHIRQTHST